MRFIAGKKSGKVTLYSRNRKHRNKIYPEVVDGLANMEGDSLVDGEIVAFSGSLSSFSRLQHRMQVREPDRKLLRSVPVRVHLFDILFLDGNDVRELPLRRRKTILKSAFEFADPIRYQASQPSASFVPQPFHPGDPTLVPSADPESP